MFYKKLCVSIARGHGSASGGGGVAAPLSPSEDLWQDILLP